MKSSQNALWLFRIFTICILTGLIGCGESRPGKEAPAEFVGHSTDAEPAKTTPAASTENSSHKTPDDVNLGPVSSEPRNEDDDDKSFNQQLDLFEAKASEKERVILSTARKMIVDEVIVVGSCWDYINAVYNKVGITDKKRIYAFKSKKSGPFASADKVKPGDWLYFINHSYGDVEHSAIFVGWSDLENNEALMISYSGGNHNTPGRYRYYDLSSIYSIIRAE